MMRAEAVICGAGIAGIATAYHLAVKQGVGEVVIVDERAPLTLTSDKSTECYRNWWPGPGDAMVWMMNRSIDLMEELARDSNNAFHLNRRGYLYVTLEKDGRGKLERFAAEASGLGAGEVRVHESGQTEYRPAPAEGFEGQPDGADLILDQGLIQAHFPYLAEDTAAVLHVRRAGWLSAQQYGMYLLERAREAGVRLVDGKVTSVQIEGGRVTAVELAGGETISTPQFVNAAGPFLKEVGEMLGAAIPVHNELHQKVAFDDPLGVIPREAPLVIFSDAQNLAWSTEERQMLAEDEETRWLTGELPSGAHTRPEGSANAQTILVLWDAREERVEAKVPPALDPLYPEIALRGLCRLIPRMGAYLEKLPKPYLDGGYYTRTEENRPLACPLEVEGAFVIGAMAGYGIMAAAGMAELAALQVTGGGLPEYAPAFDLRRYEDSHYQSLLENWGATWQL